LHHDNDVLVTARQDIKNLEERLMRNAATMTDAEAKDLSYKIRDKKREFQREQREFGEDYNLRRNEELNQVQKAIVKTIQKFAEQEKYDLILSEGKICLT
jgi:outer membrane protein